MIWACWQQATPYNPALHTAALRATALPTRLRGLKRYVAREVYHCLAITPVGDPGQPGGSPQPP